MNKHPLDEQLEAGLRGDFERAWKIAQRLEKETPQCNRAAFNRAWYCMWKGDLLQGLKLLDHGRWEKVFGDSPLPTSKPIWRREALQNKHVLICLEGGLGDEIINVRFAQDFADKGAKVTVCCDPGLMSVFARAPGVTTIVSHKAAPHVYHDFWVPGMSAPRVLEYTYQKLSGTPYLFADPMYVKKWQHLKGRIGLRFYGNPEFEHEQHRAFPKQDLIQAVGHRPDLLPWVNLQKEETDLKLESWEDTLGVIANLKLVITSCTSVAHASAAMGKETWVIVPILPYYIWALPGESTPWYKSVCLFRQNKFADWKNVFDEIKSRLWV